MDNVRIVLILGFNNIRRWAFNPRYYIIGILGAMWIHFIVHSISRFTNAVQVSATPWVFSFVLLHRYTPMLIMLGATFLFADAPFMNSSTPYEIIRSGKRRWVVAQVFYILLASIIWVFFLFTISVLCLIPNLTFSWQWGKVYSTLAQTTASVQYGINLIFSYEIIQTFSPVQATMYAILILFLEVLFLGMLILAISILFSRTIALFTALILSFMPAGLAVSGVPFFYYFVPTSWSNLTWFVPNNHLGYPSLPYSLLFLLIANLILGLVTVVFAPKKEIKVMLPV